MKSGSVKAVTMPPDRVTYIARRASPSARSTPESAMPSPIGILAGNDDRQHAARHFRRAPLRVHQAHQRRVAEYPQKQRKRRGRDKGDREAGCREPARARPIAGAERARDGRRDRDREPDVDRHQQERGLARIADRRLVGLVAEARDPEQREHVDRENRDQPDRPGRGHDGDVSHQRALCEYRSMQPLGLGVEGGSGGQGVDPGAAARLRLLEAPRTRRQFKTGRALTCARPFPKTAFRRRFARCLKSRSSASFLRAARILRGRRQGDRRRRDRAENPWRAGLCQARDRPQQICRRFAQGQGRRVHQGAERSAARRRASDLLRPRRRQGRSRRGRAARAVHDRRDLPAGHQGASRGAGRITNAADMSC